MWSWTFRSPIWLQHQIDKCSTRGKVTAGPWWTVSSLHSLLWKGLYIAGFYKMLLFGILFLLLSHLVLIHYYMWIICLKCRCSQEASMIFTYVSFHWLFILIQCPGLGECQDCWSYLRRGQLPLLTKDPSFLLLGWWLGWALNWNFWHL